MDVQSPKAAQVQWIEEKLKNKLTEKKEKKNKIVNVTSSTNKSLKNKS